MPDKKEREPGRPADYGSATPADVAAAVARRPRPLAREATA